MYSRNFIHNERKKSHCFNGEVRYAVDNYKILSLN